MKEIQLVFQVDVIYMVSKLDTNQAVPDFVHQQYLECYKKTS